MPNDDERSARKDGEVSDAAAAGPGALEEQVRRRTEHLERLIAAQQVEIEALRASEGNYSEIIENVNDGIVIVQDGAARFLNRKTRETFLLPEDPMPSVPVLEMVNPEDKEKVFTYYEARLAGRPVPSEYDLRIRVPSGEYRWFRMMPVRILWNGRPAILATMRDVNDYLRAEEESRAARERLELVTQHVGAGIAIISKEYRTIWANQVLRRMYGEIEGRICYEAYNNQKEICAGCGVRTIFETGVGMVQHEQRGRDAAGKEIWAQIVATPIRDAGGNVTGALEVVIPTTERKRLEREALDAAAMEQQRISRDLHDSVGQELTGLSCMAKSLAHRLAERSAPESEVAGSLAEGISRALSPLRDAIRGLAPVPLGTDGLAAALEQLVAETQERCSLTCLFESSGSVRVQPAETASHLYRIAQEAINNAVRHSRARTLTVRLESLGGQILLTVRDDGVGIGPEKERTESGLRIMRYRASAIGASLRVESDVQGGTVVSCRVAGGRPARGSGRRRSS